MKNINLTTTEAIETRRELFENTMRNLKVTETEESGNAMIGSVSVPLSLCYIDTNYQRERTDSEINKFAKNWIPSLVMPILLVPHPEECRFAVVDGQKRTLTAPLKGKNALGANIVLNAPQPPRNIKQEYC